MARVRIIVEGETEASFISGPLYHSLIPHGVVALPTVLGISGHRGGRVNYQRVKKDVPRTLKQDRTVYCSTLFDLYGLGDGFPEGQGSHLTGLARVSQLELAISNDVMLEVPELRPDIRFIPYIQIYEFEGLLFSDPAALARGMSRIELQSKLQLIRDSFLTPEDINDSQETAPSKRILKLDRGYDKVISGTLAVNNMGIDVIKQNCPRFSLWFDRLVALGSAIVS